MDLSTTNLLRPHQVADARDELRRIDETLSAPPHIRSKVSDPRAMAQRRARLKKELETYEPKPFTEKDRDSAVREFARLGEQIREAMPSSEEMRRNPPGAVGKQIAWQKKNGKRVQQWKHIALRLQAGGDVPDHLTDGGDVANVERLRPLTTPVQLAMDGAQIPKTTDYHFGGDIANTVTFSDDDLAVLADLSPDLADKLALLPAEMRAGIKAIIAKAKGLDAAPPRAVKKVRLNKGASRYTSLCKLAKANGINSWGLSIVKLEQALTDKRVAF